MQPLYPPIKPNKSEFLNVGDNHEIYIEECGDPHGIPVVVVHSGPGEGCSAYHRRFFDPTLYRIILFDQRGTGRSKPHAELKNNTTQHLIADIEAIRQHLNIDTWALFGGAWGSALSLLYAQQYPQHISGLILHSIFLARKSDIDWFYKKGANLIFPDDWNQFTESLSDEEKQNPLESYYKRLCEKDEITRMSCAKSWSLWQARCATLQPHQSVIDNYRDPRFAVGLATIETHYLMNQLFIEEGEVFKDIDKIKNIRGYIIHGRYDIVTPLENAWTLHQQWPNAELYIVREAGHSAKEVSISDALVLATKNFAQTLLNPA